MSNIVHTEEFANCTITIERDEFAESPSELYDDGVFLIAGHRQFYVERDGWDPRDASNPDKKRYYIAPIEAYIHSGVSIAFAGTGTFPDRRWDVSRVGYIVVDKQMSGIESDELARLAAEGLLNEWNDYLHGRIFRYHVKHNITGTQEDCGGFHDSRWDGSSYCLVEARQVAESLDRWAKKAV